MNRHCQCALIVGPVVERRGKCRKICGGKADGEYGVGGQRRRGEMDMCWRRREERRRPEAS